MSTARPIRFDSAPRGCFFKPAPRYGFTLLELLVVIGIIAVLIGILMPALAAARRSAQTIKCQANLRTLGQAMMMHSNEHRGFFPLSGLIYNGATNTASPKGLGDGTMQRYDYFNNSTTTPTTLVLDALPCAYRFTWGFPAARCRARDINGKMHMPTRCRSGLISLVLQMRSLLQPNGNLRMP